MGGTKKGGDFTVCKVSALCFGFGLSRLSDGGQTARCPLTFFPPSPKLAGVSAQAPRHLFPVREGMDMAVISDRLVFNYIENVPRNVLTKYPEVCGKYFGDTPGIYALHSKNRLQYIGMASNLNVRLNSHHKDRKMPPWDRFSVYYTQYGEYNNELASLFSRITTPPKAKKQSLPYSDSLRYMMAKDVELVQKNGSSALRATLAPKSEKPQPPTPLSPRKASTTPGSLDPYVKKRFTIACQYKGVVHRATVRQNGLIYFDGGLYTTPSAAAKAVTGKKTDGWKFWRFKNKVGKWAPLTELK